MAPPFVHGILVLGRSFAAQSRRAAFVPRNIKLNIGNRCGYFRFPHKHNAWVLLLIQTGASVLFYYHSEIGQNTQWLLSYATTHVNGSIALQLEDFCVRIA